MNENDFSEDTYGQLSVPEVKKYGDESYELFWSEGVTMKVNQFYTHRDKNIEAEVTITDSMEINTHVLGPQRFSLTKSPRSLLKDLEDASSRDNWAIRMKQVSYLILEDYRKGTPIINLGQLDRPTAPRHRLTPIAYEGEATLVYGTGGIGKSMLVLYFAHLIHNGIPYRAGLGDVVQGNVLFIDYETNENTNWLRSWDIIEGLDLPRETQDERMNSMVNYWFGKHALVNHVQELQEEIARKNIQVLIVDSAGPACGGTPEDAQSALSYFSALRALAPANKPLTTITIGHVAKGFQGAQSGPFGSVYWVNYPRSTWELKKATQTGTSEMSLTLHHRKTNLGMLHSPIGFGMDFEHGVQLEAKGAQADRTGSILSQVVTKMEEYADTGHSLFKDGMTTADIDDDIVKGGNIQSLSTQLSREANTEGGGKGRVKFNKDTKKWQVNRF